MLRTQCCNHIDKLNVTRIHSNRMRTARLLHRGVFAREGCLPRGCLPGGVCPGVCGRYRPGQTSPPVDRMTGRCKNITLPQLRCGAVNMYILVQDPFRIDNISRKVLRKNIRCCCVVSRYLIRHVNCSGLCHSHYLNIDLLILHEYSCDQTERKETRK